VLLFVFGADYRAEDVARDEESVRAGNRCSDYLYFEEVTMETTTERRNFKLYGEAHPNAKLTRAQVIEIRREAQVPGTSRAFLAARYMVSRSAIDRVVLEQTWKEAL
jgi:hypothetical protein